MLGKYCQELGDYIFADFSLRMTRLGIQTWMMNLCGIGSAVGAFYLIKAHKVNIALVLFLISYFFYYMDGSISDARHFCNKHSIRYHKIYHGISDIIAEGIFFCGLASYGYVLWRYSLIVIATYMVFMILDILANHKRISDPDESFFDRLDRFIAFVVFILLKQYVLSLVVVSLITTIGVIQRLVALIRTKQPKLI
jgi:hypothetical protein